MGADRVAKMVRVVTLLMVVIALGALSACGRKDRGAGEPARPENADRRGSIDLEGANVLLITIDTTRADRLGSYGHPEAETPRIDTLARDGVLFETAITPTAFTLPSHSSIMTGLYPPFHGVRLNGGSALADLHTTLAEQLASAGYRCGAVVGAFVLDQRWGLDQGFDFFDDDIEMAPDQKLDLAGVQRRGDTVVNIGIEWLERPDPQPFFAWIHLYDPHISYDPPEPFKSRFAGKGRSGLYDGEIAYTDSQIGRLLDWLDSRGLADETVVVVVGDHGEGLGDHGEKEHGYYIYDATTHVPLIVRLPEMRFAGTRVSAQVRTIDVMPTILDLVGLDAPQPVQGQSLVPLMTSPDADGPYAAYSESMSIHLQYGWSALYSLRTATHKYIDAPRAELYDLTNDPGETDNRFASDPVLAETMQAQLADLRSGIETGAPETQEADLDEETMGMLAALGYVGGATAAPEGDDLADPKDKLHIFESVGYASHLLTGDQIEEAVEVLEVVLDQDDAVPQARLMLATAYRKLGRNQDAKALLDPFLRDNPDNVVALVTMATILSEEGRDDEVLALTRRVLAEDDRNTQAWELMAGVHMRAKDHAGALPMLERAAEIQPKLTRPRLNLAVAMIGLGRYREAEDLLREIIDERPEFPLAHFHLGLMYEEQGRVADAKAAYAAEIALHDTAVLARFNLGNIYFGIEDFDAAEREMRLLIEQAPDVAKSYLLLARILLKQGRDLSEVEDLAKTGIELSDDDSLKTLGYYVLADVYSRQDRHADLDRALERAQYYRARVEGQE